MAEEKEWTPKTPEDLAILLDAVLPKRFDQINAPVPGNDKSDLGRLRRYNEDRLSDKNTVELELSGNVSESDPAAKKALVPLETTLKAEGILKQNATIFKEYLGNDGGKYSYIGISIDDCNLEGLKKLHLVDKREEKENRAQLHNKLNDSLAPLETLNRHNTHTALTVEALALYMGTSSSSVDANGNYKLFRPNNIPEAEFKIFTDGLRKTLAPYNVVIGAFEKPEIGTAFVPVSGEALSSPEKLAELHKTLGLEARTIDKEYFCFNNSPRDFREEYEKQIKAQGGDAAYNAMDTISQRRMMERTFQDIVGMRIHGPIVDATAFAYVPGKNRYEARALNLDNGILEGSPITFDPSAYNAALNHHGITVEFKRDSEKGVIYIDAASVTKDQADKLTKLRNDLAFVPEETNEAKKEKGTLRDEFKAIHENLRILSAKEDKSASQFEKPMPTKTPATETAPADASKAAMAAGAAAMAQELKKARQSLREIAESIVASGQESDANWKKIMERMERISPAATPLNPNDLQELAETKRYFASMAKYYLDPPHDLAKEDADAFKEVSAKLLPKAARKLNGFAKKEGQSFKDLATDALATYASGITYEQAMGALSAIKVDPFGPEASVAPSERQAATLSFKKPDVPEPAATPAIPPVMPERSDIASTGSPPTIPSKPMPKASSTASVAAVKVPEENEPADAHKTGSLSLLGMGAFLANHSEILDGIKQKLDPLASKAKAIVEPYLPAAEESSGSSYSSRSSSSSGGSSGADNSTGKPGDVKDDKKIPPELIGGGLGLAALAAGLFSGMDFLMALIVAVVVGFAAKFGMDYLSKQESASSAAPSPDTASIMNPESHHTAAVRQPQLGDLVTPGSSRLAVQDIKISPEHFHAGSLPAVVSGAIHKS